MTRSGWCSGSQQPQQPPCSARTNPHTQEAPLRARPCSPGLPGSSRKLTVGTRRTPPRLPPARQGQACSRQPSPRTAGAAGRRPAGLHGMGQARHPVSVAGWLSAVRGAGCLCCVLHFLAAHPCKRRRLACAQRRTPYTHLHSPRDRECAQCARARRGRTPSINRRACARTPAPRRTAPAPSDHRLGAPRTAVTPGPAMGGAARATHHPALPRHRQ